MVKNKNQIVCIRRLNILQMTLCSFVAPVSIASASFIEAIIHNCLVAFGANQKKKPAGEGDLFCSVRVSSI